jgi:hypothetical protein
MKMNRILSFVLGFILVLNEPVLAQEEVKPFGLGLQSNLFQVPLSDKSVQIHQTSVYLFYKFNCFQLNAGLHNALQLKSESNIYESVNGLIVGLNYHLPFIWKKSPTALHVSWIIELEELNIRTQNQLNFGFRQYLNQHCYIGTGLHWLQNNRINAGQDLNWFWQLGVEF